MYVCVCVRAHARASVIFLIEKEHTVHLTRKKTKIMCLHEQVGLQRLKNTINNGRIRMIQGFLVVNCLFVCLFVCLCVGFFFCLFVFVCFFFDDVIWVSDTVCSIQN